jgi:hypothetical protein
VNVALFVLVFLIFGLVAAPTFDAVERRLPRLPPRRPVTLKRLAGYGVMTFTIFVLGLVAVFGFGLGLLILVLFAFVHELGNAVARARERGDRRLAVRAAYLLPLAFVVAGAVFTAGAIRQLLG